MADFYRSLQARLRVKGDLDDGSGGREATAWGNKDIWPVPPEQRHLNALSYMSFWAIASMSITGWAFGGSLVALGVSTADGIGCIFVACAVVAMFSVLCGHPGSEKHLGFTALARTSFGLYGSYLPVILLVFENVVFFGIHGYFGGLSTSVVISAMSPSYKNMENTLPLSAEVETRDIIGFVIYIVIFLALLAIHPSKYKPLVWPAALAVTLVFFGMFGWAIGVNGGSPGNLIKPKIKLSATKRAFQMLYAISSAAGSTTAYGCRLADWTRFSKSKNAPTVTLLVGPILFGSLAPILGILATSAVKSRYGVELWNPLQLLMYIQKAHYTSAGRAATFFAGIALFWSLIMNNIMGKILPAGMDCAGLWPRYITTKRGSVLLTIIGVVIQPWRLVNAPSTFLTVLSSFGVFVAPIAGILAVDYWLVRRRHWKIPDIFEPHGIYWYTFGVNWRAVTAFFFSFVFSMPGFICAVDKTPIAVGWTRLYQISYFSNVSIAAFLHYTLSIIFPPDGQGVSEDWEHGVPQSSDERQKDTDLKPEGEARMEYTEALTAYP